VNEEFYQKSCKNHEKIMKNHSKNTSFLVKINTYMNNNLDATNETQRERVKNKLYKKIIGVKYFHHKKHIIFGLFFVHQNMTKT